MSKNPVLIGVTGASGSIYARRLAEELVAMGIRVELIATEAGQQVLRYENESELLEIVDEVHDIKNFFSAPASGTSRYLAMVILPCSMGTLGKLAHGIGDNLLTRAGDVFLKERRKLVIVGREMPYNEFHLENMTRLSKAGAVMMSASPFFYYQPKTIDELVDTVVGKVLDQLDIEHKLYKPWMQ